MINRSLGCDGNVLHIFAFFVRTLPEGRYPEFDTLWQRFFQKHQDPEKKAEQAVFRKKRLKYGCNLTECPTGVKVFLENVGGTRPVILGNTIGAEFFDGPNYVEVSIDTTANALGKLMGSKVVSSAKDMVVDEFFALEGQSVPELPELPLCTVRFHRTDLRKVRRPWPDVGPAAT